MISDENAMMVRRRQEVQMYDQAVNQGADPQPFNEQRCTRSGMLLGALPVLRQLCGGMPMDPGISLPGKCPSAGIATPCVRLKLKSNQ